jgi:uncharacterized protein YyaL (SSP411 family)
LLDAYANMLAGSLELYETTLKPEYLQFCLELADGIMTRFYDAAEGGFWQSPAGSADLIVRVKDDYDGAEPSGNSVATRAFLKLAAITARDDYRKAGEKTLRLFTDKMQRAPQGVPNMLMALDYDLEEPKRVVLVADQADAARQDLLRAVHEVYQPNKVVLSSEGPVEKFARTLPKQAGKAVAFLCSGAACQPPTDSAAKLKEGLVKAEPFPGGKR